MSKWKKKKETHEEVEHISDDAVQLSESWIAEEPKKIETDLEKHAKFSKFKEGKK